MPLSQDKWGFVGGDMEPPRLLDELARRHPDDKFIIVSQARGNPQDAGLPSNVINSWTQERLDYLREENRRPFGKLNSPMTAEQCAHVQDVADNLYFPMFDRLDAVIVWLGQHGTSNSRIPVVTDRGGQADGLTKPQDAFMHYAGGLIRGINHWRDVDPIAREEVYLIADARNYVKCRDLKWTLRHPVLGQFKFSQNARHERYGDMRTPEECGFEGTMDTNHTWATKHHYDYAQLEVCGITPEHVDSQYQENWSDRAHFGLFINEARAYVKNGRRPIVKSWVLPLDPAFIHGSWPDDHEQEFGRRIEPIGWELYFPKLRSVKCTLTTPSSGSGWATTKPWEAFAVGTVCFFHPAYDTQGHILRDAPAELKEWLRCPSADELRKRVYHLSTNEAAWLWLVREQRKLYDQAMLERRWVARIEERIWG